MFKNTLLAGIIYFLFISVSLFSQENWYQPFAGNADGLNVMFHLHKSNNKLWGTLNVQNTKESAQTGICYFLDGSLNEAGIIKLSKAGEENVVVDGIINGEVFSGTLMLYDVEQSFTSKAIEVDDYQSFQLVLRNADMKLFPDNPSSPSALIEYTLLFPETAASSLFIDAVSDFYGLQTLINRQTPSKIIDIEIDAFFNQYKELANIAGEMSPSFQWVKSVQSSIVFNSADLVCLHRSTYVFTGGAHGMKHDAFGLFEVESGKKLLVSDVFIKDFQHELNHLLTAKLKAKQGLTEDELLSSNGYFVDAIESNENFYLSPSGIGFYYNSYEIAPYSTGHSNLFLPFSEIAHLMKPELKALVDF
jgi:hypothetical protein